MMTVHTKKQCLYALMHCSYPMNTALGAGPKKKEKMAETQNVQMWT